MGSGIDYQQMGNTWTDSGSIVSLSLNGNLNIFDPRAGDKASRILHVSVISLSIAVELHTNRPNQGSQKGITASASTKDSTLFAGSYDGRVLAYETESGTISETTGSSHAGQVVAISASPDVLYSTGFDDCVRELRTTTKSFT